MEKVATGTRLRSIPLITLAVTLAGCGGHSGSSPTAPAAGVPVISNLSAGFGGSCTVGGRPGTALTATVSYADSDGDVVGGVLQTTGTFHPSGTSIDVNFQLPSAGATITGTTQGTIQAFGCVRFGVETGLTFAVALVDKASHSSNILSIELGRPGGAPEEPRDGGRAILAPRRR